MAKCACCGKGVTFGIKVSHSHRRANRTWKPNVRRVKAVVDGSPRYIYACTRCLRSGKRLKRSCMPRTLVRGFFVCRPAPAEGQPRPGAAGARRGAAQPAGPRRLWGAFVQNMARAAEVCAHGASNTPFEGIFFCLLY